VHLRRRDSLDLVDMRTRGSHRVCPLWPSTLRPRDRRKRPLPGRTAASRVPGAGRGSVFEGPVAGHAASVDCRQGSGATQPQTSRMTHLPDVCSSPHGPVRSDNVVPIYKLCVRTKLSMYITAAQFGARFPNHHPGGMRCSRSRASSGPTRSTM
jgi:hypothetical protein